MASFSGHVVLITGTWSPVLGEYEQNAFRTPPVSIMNVQWCSQIFIDQTNVT